MLPPALLFSELLYSGHLLSFLYLALVPKLLVYPSSAVSSIVMTQLDVVFSRGIRAGVIVSSSGFMRIYSSDSLLGQVMATIASISTLLIVLLLVHIIGVSFVPLCLSAMNLRRGLKNRKHLPSASNSGGSASGTHTGRKLSTDTEQGAAIRGVGSDIERAKTVAERQARARAREISRQQTKQTEERLFLRMQLGWVEYGT